MKPAIYDPARVASVSIHSLDRRTMVLIAALALGHFLFAGWLCISLAPWQDEMATLFTTGSGVRHAIRKGVEFELQAPGYFALIAAWREVFPTVVGVRFFSLICSTATIFGVVALVRSLIPWVPVVWAAAVMATNPLLLWSGTEARSYAFAHLLATLTCLAFAKAYWQGDSRRRWRVLYSGCAVVGLLTQFYLGFLLPMLGIALLATRRWRSVRRMVIDLIPALAAMALVVTWLRAMPNTVLGSGSTFPPTLRPLLVTLERGAIHTIDVDSAAHGVMYVLKQVHRVTVWGLVAASLALRSRLVPLSVSALVPALGAGSMVLGAVVTSVAGASWDIWHATCSIVPLALAPLALTFAVRRNLGVTCAILVCLSGAGRCLDRGVLQHAKPGDPEGVARALEQLVSAEDLVLVAPADVAWALEPLYHGRAPIIPLPAPANLDNFGVVVPREPGDVARALERAKPEARSLWIHVYDYDLGGRAVDEFLKSEGWDEARRVRLRSGVVLRQFLRRSGTSQG